MLLSISLRADTKKQQDYICIKYPPNSTLYSYRKRRQALSTAYRLNRGGYMIYNVLISVGYLRINAINRQKEHFWGCFLDPKKCSCRLHCAQLTNTISSTYVSNIPPIQLCTAIERGAKPFLSLYRLNSVGYNDT
jgi:hypothetical protein